MTQKKRLFQNGDGEKHEMLNTAELECLTDRERERRLLKLVCDKLVAAKSAVGSDSPQELAKLHDALQHNTEVWNAFVLDALHIDNKLPSELKILVANLSVFVNRLSKTIAHAPAVTDIDYLVSINEFVAEGLCEASAIAKPA